MNIAIIFYFKRKKIFMSNLCNSDGNVVPRANSAGCVGTANRFVVWFLQHETDLPLSCRWLAPVRLACSSGGLLGWLGGGRGTSAMLKKHNFKMLEFSSVQKVRS